MAGNEWIYGYLDAIINVGGEGGLSGKVSGGDHPHSHPHRNIPVVAQGRLNFNPSTYFVEEVITSYDEADLHRTWMKAIAMRNSQERNVRMENLCWRIWHLARRKKQAALEDSQRMSHRNYEREQGLKTAAEDFSAEDLSEGDYKEKLELESASLIAAATAASGDSSKMFQNNSFVDVSADDNPSQTKRLYIVLISVHGLVRGDNMELGRDSDTGGQVKYVVELARALATMPQVYRVDLLTRQILSPEVDWSYGEPTEMLTLPSSLLSSRGGGGGGGGGSSGGCAYIVRIPCGPREKYIRKELLWPYLQEFVDGALAHILNMARVLGEQIKLDKEQYVWPHVIHGHYADAGGIAALLSGSLNVPMVLTGHSLGRNKLEQLLKQGWQSKEEINATYKIMPRIEAEELSLDAAELVITSTQQEIEEQWGLYDGFDVRLERVLRARMKRGVSCHGRYMPRMVVIPPGMDFSNVLPPDFGESGEGDTEVDPLSPRQEPLIWSEIKRFLNNPHKPMILALARPDPKKNITTLLKAFGECRPLRDLANLTLIIGNRDDIDDMPGGNALVLITVLKLIDKYDLYGQVAFPKHHKQQDVPDIYRLAARTKGVFINPALVEPFGLTLIEAAAHGLPIVATKNGGPVDIQRSLRNGLLVDPYDSNSIADALLKLVSDRSLWTECRRNGLKNISLYSWPQHCRVYLAHIAQCRMRHPLWKDVGETGEGGAGGVGPSAAGDSLKDEQDLSLRLSIDEKVLSGSGSSSALDILTESSAESQRGTARYCGFNTPISSLKKALEITKFRKESLASANEQSVVSSLDKSIDKISSFGNGNSLYKSPSSLRRRRRILVVSVDAYDPLGKAGERMLHVMSEIFNAMKHYKTYNSMHFGFILSTAMTLSETIGLLCMGDIPLHEFSALICSSGSELYYPTPIQSEDTSASSSSLESQFYFDPDYATHIDYRWAGDGIKRSSQKLLASSEGDKGQRSGGGDIAFLADEESSSMHCLAYEVKDPSRAPKVDELRKRFRMCGLRSHILYCKNQTRLHILPLFASRSQALRYLFVRWGADISNMIVFVGEMGDSDYEEQLPGMHKTVILRGAIESGCDQSLSGTTIITSSGDTSYHKDDATQPSKSGNIVTSESCTVEAITNVLKELFG